MRPGADQRRDYLHGLKAAASGNARAFGFSILITVSYGITAASEPVPSLAEQFAFAMAAVAAFSMLDVAVAILARGESGHVGSKRVLLISTSTDFIAVGVGLAAALGVESVVSGFAAWILVPFAAGLCYLLVQAAELTVGREAERP